MYVSLVHVVIQDSNDIKSNIHFLAVDLYFSSFMATMQRRSCEAFSVWVWHCCCVRTQGKRVGCVKERVGCGLRVRKGIVEDRENFLLFLQKCVCVFLWETVKIVSLFFLTWSIEKWGDYMTKRKFLTVGMEMYSKCVFPTSKSSVYGCMHTNKSGEPSSWWLMALLGFECLV